MEEQRMLRLQIMFVMFSLTSSIPVALRSPLNERNISMRPWREVPLRNSEEDYGRNVRTPSGINSIYPIRNAFSYPEDSHQSAVPYTYRNSFLWQVREPSLERFYKQRSSSYNTGRQRIVFPTDEPTPENKADKRKDVAELIHGFVSEKSLENQAERKIIDETDRDTQEKIPGHYDRETLSQEVESTPAPEDDVDMSTTTEEFVILEQSLYTGPTIKTNEDGGCPEGFKKTRNGSCQKPSRRLTQTG